MFCIKCGAAEQEANAYCKRCGEWLPDVSGAARRRQSPEQSLNTIIWLSGISALFALFSAFVLYSTFFSVSRSWQIALAAAFTTCIFTYQLTTFVNSLKLRQRIKQARAGSSDDVSMARRTGELNDAVRGALPNGKTTDFVPARTTAYVTPAASVTEGTTQLLDCRTDDVRRRHESAAEQNPRGDAR